MTRSWFGRQRRYLPVAESEQLAEQRAVQSPDVERGACWVGQAALNAKRYGGHIGIACWRGIAG